jgi:ISXO2-like transposase domain
VTWRSREEDFVATTNRMVVLFTMMNAATDVACAISAAAMDDLDESTGTKPGQQAGHVTVSAINHEEAYSMDDVCTNWAEEFFSRMRGAEIGIDHHIAGTYLCGMPKRGLGEGTTAVCRTVSKSTASQLCL